MTDLENLSDSNPGCVGLARRAYVGDSSRERGVASCLDPARPDAIATVPSCSAGAFRQLALREGRPARWHALLRHADGRERTDDSHGNRDLEIRPSETPEAPHRDHQPCLTLQDTRPRGGRLISMLREMHGTSVSKTWDGGSAAVLTIAKARTSLRCPETRVRNTRRGPSRGTPRSDDDGSRAARSTRWPRRSRSSTCASRRRSRPSGIMSRAPKSTHATEVAQGTPGRRLIMMSVPPGPFPGFRFVRTSERVLELQGWRGVGAKTIVVQWNDDVRRDRCLLGHRIP